MKLLILFMMVFEINIFIICNKRILRLRILILRILRLRIFIR